MLPALDGLICELELVGAEVLVVGIVLVVEVAPVEMFLVMVE